MSESTNSGTAVWLIGHNL